MLWLYKVINCIHQGSEWRMIYGWEQDLHPCRNITRLYPDQVYGRWQFIDHQCRNIAIGDHYEKYLGISEEN